MFELLRARAQGATICPSEVARELVGALSDEGITEDWRALMEPVRQVARAQCHLGRVQITQSGSVIDPDNFKGPIRIRLLDG